MASADAATAVVGTVALYALVWVLHVVVPVATTPGYACDCNTGNVLRYRNNGLRVCAIAIVLAAGAVLSGLVRASDLAVAYWPAAGTACVLGLAASLALWVRGMRRLRATPVEVAPSTTAAATHVASRRASAHVSTRRAKGPARRRTSSTSAESRLANGPSQSSEDGATTAALVQIDRGQVCLTIAGPRTAASADPSEFAARSPLAHFYYGIEWNPRPVAGVDVKMFDYLLGAVVLALLVLSAVALHVETRCGERFVVDDDGGDSGASGVALAAMCPGDAAACGAFAPGASRGGDVGDIASAVMAPLRTALASIRASSNAMRVYAGCMLWFVGEYLWHEEVHVFTYDIFRERTGFRMVWGCFCLYPFLYSIGVWPLVGGGHSGAGREACVGHGDAAVAASLYPRGDLTPLGAIGVAALFACGWALTRGANLQKHAFKTAQVREQQQARGRDAKRDITAAGAGVGGAIGTDSVVASPAPSPAGYDRSAVGHDVPRPLSHRLFGLPCLRVELRAVPGSRGRLLCSGLWGVSRHVNYLGEIIQGVALALPGWLVTGSMSPWLYPVYYVALLLPRQADDDAACEAKYGAAWLEYCRRVPWRVVPGVW